MMNKTPYRSPMYHAHPFILNTTVLSDIGIYFHCAVEVNGGYIKVRSGNAWVVPLPYSCTLFTVF